MTTTAICEACRAARATRETEADEPRFRVCEPCGKRLEGRALRPLEWFNLASLHGPQPFLLHDDFYDDNGRAWQPAIPVEHPELFPVPTLGELEGNADRLLDYAVTRYFVWEQTAPAFVAALRRLDAATLLRRLEHRTAASKSEHVEHVCLVVCGHAVGPLGARWVEERYTAPTAPRMVGALGYAGSRCLGGSRGFDLTARTLTMVTENLAQSAFSSLGWYRSPRTLDWIEGAAGAPLMETWGRLAAVSKPPWSRLATWLTTGRPLSLVALDALVEIGKGRAVGLLGGAAAVRWLQPELLDPPTRETAASTFETYVARDDTPRARRAVRAILRNWGLIAERAATEWAGE